MSGFVGSLIGAIVTIVGVFVTVRWQAKTDREALKDQREALDRQLKEQENSLNKELEALRKQDSANREVVAIADFIAAGQSFWYFRNDKSVRLEDLIAKFDSAAVRWRLEVDFEPLVMELMRWPEFMNLVTYKIATTPNVTAEDGYNPIPPLQEALRFCGDAVRTTGVNWVQAKEHERQDVVDNFASLREIIQQQYNF